MPLVAIAANAAILSFARATLATHGPLSACPHMDRAEQIRKILSARGLTLYQVSQQSAQIFGRSSPCYVPHNLYSHLANSILAPTIQQMLALSHITKYRLNDLLAVIGIDLDAASRLRLLIPRKQTLLIDSTVYDLEAWIPWFAGRKWTGPVPAIAPLTQLLARAEPRRAKDLLDLNKREFVYAKVGEEDVYALPRFAPGSIVRADPQRVESLLLVSKATAESPYFLIEEAFGCHCAQLVLLTKDRALLLSPQQPCAQREVRLGTNARVLGVIDAEIRPLKNLRKTGSLHRPTALHTSAPLTSTSQETSLQFLLRNSRLKTGLSFREASSLSRWIAETLSNELYFASASTLSDYETLASPPRHIQKFLTLCVLYSIEPGAFLRSSGIPLGLEGHEPMPDELARRHASSRRHSLPVAVEKESPREPAGFLGSFLEQWEGIPLFLRHSLEEITGLKNFSLSDVFWVGGEKAPLHPLLIHAVLVAVNRRVKKPLPAAGNHACQPQLYLILRRDGSYLCGPFLLQQGNLVLPACPGALPSTQGFRNGADAEVIGQVKTILRRLL